ncbi:MAG: SIS domain-containing protein [Bacteroidota bacterium]
MIKNYPTNYLSSLDESLRNTAVTDVEGRMLGLDKGLAMTNELTTVTQAAKGRLFFAGNGASASFATHMALDWSKNGGVSVIGMHDPAQLTALANDNGYEEVFAAPVKWHGRAEDILVTISSSGNSPNIINAIEAAREVGMKVITYTGLKEDNKSRQLGDVNWFVPAKTYGVVECAHQSLLHMWLDSFMGITEWNRDDAQNMNKKYFRL